MKQQRKDTNTQADAYQLAGMSERQIALAIARLMMQIEEHDNWSGDMDQLIKELRGWLKARADQGEWPHQVAGRDKSFNAWRTKTFLAALRPLTTDAKAQKMLFGRLPVDTVNKSKAFGGDARAQLLRRILAEAGDLPNAEDLTAEEAALLAKLGLKAPSRKSKARRLLFGHIPLRD